MNKDIESIVVSEEELNVISSRAAEWINKKFKNETKPPLIVGILKGCVPFYADVLKKIKVEVLTDFMAVSSYYKDVKSNGRPKINMDINEDIEDRVVVILEDIVETASTLTKIIKFLELRNPKKVYVLTCVDKVEGRKVEYTPDFIGKTVPNHFLVGYGLDYAGKYRNLPYVGILKKSIYTKK